jgi:hypothetical protein
MLASMRVKRRRAQIQAARQSPEEIERANRVCASCSMPSSNTPSDSECDRLCIKRCVYKRPVRSILGRYQGASMTSVPSSKVLRWAIREGNPTRSVFGASMWRLIGSDRAASTHGIPETSHIRLSSGKFYAAAECEISGANSLVGSDIAVSSM